MPETTHRFRVGDRVQVEPANPVGNPRTPAYIRGKSGVGLFGDVMMEVDWSVGRILDAIEKNGIDDNTLVIFTADNGPWLNYGNHAGSAGPPLHGHSALAFTIG